MAFLPGLPAVGAGPVIDIALVLQLRVSVYEVLVPAYGQVSAACSGVLLVLLIVTSFLADILWPAEWGEPATVRAGDRLAVPVIIEPIRGDLTGPITAQGNDPHQFSIGQQFRDGSSGYTPRN